MKNRISDIKLVDLTDDEFDVLTDRIAAERKRREQDRLAPDSAAVPPQVDERSQWNGPGSGVRIIRALLEGIEARVLIGLGAAGGSVMKHQGVIRFIIKYGITSKTSDRDLKEIVKKYHVRNPSKSKQVRQHVLHIKQILEVQAEIDAANMKKDISNDENDDEEVYVDGMNVEMFVYGCMLVGMNNAEICEKIAQKFGKVNKKNVVWYRTIANAGMNVMDGQSKTRNMYEVFVENQKLNLNEIAKIVCVSNGNSFGYVRRKIGAFANFEKAKIIIGNEKQARVQQVPTKASRCEIIAKLNAGDEVADIMKHFNISLEEFATIMQEK